MANFLQGLGQGLRVVGSTTSNENFRAFNRQNEFSNIRDNQNRQLMLGLLVRGAENGVPGADQALMKFSQENFGQGVNVGEGAQLQKLRAEQAETEAANRRREALPGELTAIADQLMVDSPALGQSASLDSSPRQDFSGTDSPVSKVDIPDTNVSGKGVLTPYEDPEKLRKLADAFDDKALSMQDKELAKRVTKQAEVLRKESERLTELYEKEGEGGDPSAAEEKVRRLQEITGKDKKGRDLAIKIADGGFRILQDSQGRDSVYDITENKIVSNIDPILIPEIKSEERQRKNIDFEAATGESGRFKRWTNSLIGLVGGGLLFKDAQEATNILQQMQNDTLALAVGKIPGRPSNFRLQLTNRLTVDPKAFFQGDAAALQKLKNTRQYLQKEATRMQKVVMDNPRAYKDSELNETANNLYLMKDIVNQYDVAIDSMSRKGKPRKPASEIWKDN